MKRAVALFSLLACAGLLLADTRDSGRAPREREGVPPLLQDLARLTKAGVPDETVLAYAKAHRGEAPSVIAADDLLWLKKSGVSEAVVRYMTAIDVRASDGGGEGTVAEEPGEGEGYPSGAYSYPESDYAYPDSYAYSGYPDSYAYGGYPDTYAYGGYPETYFADYYPFFGAGYYPYPVYFFVGDTGFFGRFHGRRHHFGRRHGDFRGHGRFRDGRHTRGGGFNRGDGGRHRGGAVIGGRGPASAGFPRRSVGPGSVPRRGIAPGFVGPRGAAPGRGGIERPVVMRGGPGPGFRAPQAVGGRGAPVRPSFSGGSRPAGGFARGPVVSSAGGPRTSGPRTVGRAGGRGGR